MAHTPGPWVLNGWDVVPSNCVDTFPALASIHNGDGSLCMEEINANARLIAAAPELLAALKVAMSYADMEMHHETVNEYWNLIAKAEGRDTSCAPTEG